MEDFKFSPELLEKVSKIPTSPGIYQYFNANGKIIYIGKAKNLRNRVRSYFHSYHSMLPKTQALVEKIADIEIIIVGSEAEALILEDTLIKQHRPRYNIMLKDSRVYPYIRITHENYARIFMTHFMIKDGSKYLGPYTEVRSVRHLLHSVQNIFQLRACDMTINDKMIEQKKVRACLDYHIHKCSGPCIGAISEEDYKKNVKMAHQVLLGKTKNLSKELEEQMNKHSEQMEYEKAAVVKQRLKSLGDFTARQKIISPENKDRDIFGIAKFGDFACTLVFVVREGKLIGKRHFIVARADLGTENEIIQKTIEKYYLETDFVPKEIIVPNEVEQMEYLLDWLGKKRIKTWQNYYENINENNYTEQSAEEIKQTKTDIENLTADSVSIKIPKSGTLMELVDMANTNASFLLKEYIDSLDKRDKKIPHSVVALQRDLNLPIPPRRIECYDNSHFQGTDMVSSMVVFIDGKPKKSEYRKFKYKEMGESEGDIVVNNVATKDNQENYTEEYIEWFPADVGFATKVPTNLSDSPRIKRENRHTGDGPPAVHNDDFEMMRQTIYRRFRRAVEEEQDLPDLVIIDGGKGQLSSAYNVLKELGLDSKVVIISLAKRLEEVFTPANKYSTLLPKTSSSLKLIQQLRDEAHRFAITFNRSLREKRAVKSELTDIKGVGTATTLKLIQKFGSVKGIKQATDEELATILNKSQLASLRKGLLNV